MRMMMLGKRTTPGPRTTLCASLGSCNGLQHLNKDTFCTEIQIDIRKKGPRPVWPEPKQSLCESLRNQNALQHFASHYMEKSTGKETRAHILCEPAKSKCMSRLHDKSHVMRKFRKMLEPE